MRQLRLFRLVFRYSRWLRERLSSAGLALAALTGFAAAFGLDTQANSAHLLFTLGFSLLLVDALLLALFGRRWAPQLTAQRHLPEFVTDGTAARYRLTLRNAGRRPLPALQLVEALRQPWPTPASWARRQGMVATNRVDQAIGYPAWLALLRRLRALDLPPLSAPPLLPGQTAAIDVALQPTARGLAAFEQLQAVQTGPLGLLARRVAVEVTPATLPVLPQRRAIELPPAAPHRQPQPGGIALAQHVGDAEEFRSLRDYRPGDPLRSIHWRSFARTGKPLVREFQEEFFSRHALVLDTAVPPARAADFETAVSLAAWLVAQPRDADSLLDLMFVGDRVHQLTAGRGLGGDDGLLRVLATVEATSTDSIEPLLASLRQHAARVSSAIAIFLLWDDRRQQAARHLLALGVPLTILVVDSTNTAPAADDREFPGIVRHVGAMATA